MSAAYASPYKAVFLCFHPKNPKVSHAAANTWENRNYSWESGVSDIKRRKLSMTFLNIDAIGKVSPKADKLIMNFFSRNLGLTSRSSKIEAERFRYTVRNYPSASPCSWYQMAQYSGKIVVKRKAISQDEATLMGERQYRQKLEQYHFYGQNFCLGQCYHITSLIISSRLV